MFFREVNNVMTLFLSILFALCLMMSSKSDAAKILVDTGDDILEQCSFRKAVVSINLGFLLDGCANSGGSFGSNDSIGFEDGISNVALDNDRLVALIFEKDIVVNVGGSRVVIDGKMQFNSVLIVAFGSNVKLHNLLITGGVGGVEFISRAGGITVRDSSLTLVNSSVAGNESTAGDGAGISAINSSVTIKNSDISNNVAEIGGVGGISVGLSSVLKLINSTVSKNIGGLGGGVVTSDSYLEIVNSTISNNRLLGETGTTFSGVAVNSGEAEIYNSTIVYNSAPIVTDPISSITAALGAVDAEVVVRNSIIANSVGHSDCATDSSVFKTSKVVFVGANIVEDGSCESSKLSNVIKADPKLDKLQTGVGRTPTHSLLPGSPAIDAGDNIVCGSPPVNNLDQLGRTRPIGTACDLGSIEGVKNVLSLEFLPSIFLILDSN